MKPPICAICGKRFDPTEGKLLSFRLTEKDLQWQKHAKITPGFVGHPPWLEWFCADHAQLFEPLLALSLAEAMQRFYEDNPS
jgi:hypothetical protein